MKIKVTKMSYDEVCALEHTSHRKPLPPAGSLNMLRRILANGDLKKAHFTYTTDISEDITVDTPVLYLMNHSSFIDLEIATKLISPKPFNIVCTSDGFVGKEGLMRRLGCIPTNKFVTDVTLVRDMVYTVKNLKSSLLMYPEASYSFDGTATPLPSSLGKCIKLLNVPVVMIKTEGAFLRDPLYNCLQVRDVDVSAHMYTLFTPDDIAALSIKDINAKLKDAFTFDHFKWQKDNHIKVDAPFRADGLNRILYKCPHCHTEGHMLGKGTTLTCNNCQTVYELDEYGSLVCLEDKSDATLDSDYDFSHIPSWYAWERSEIKKELLEGTYRMDIPVRICMMVDMKSIYEVGEGRLVHTTDGFHLTGCDGRLDYTQSASESYSLYSDYYWYEIGDVICIGNMNTLYYCFPIDCGDVVAKARMATEEIYKLAK